MALKFEDRLVMSKYFMLSLGGKEMLHGWRGFLENSPWNSQDPYFVGNDVGSMLELKFYRHSQHHPGGVYLEQGCHSIDFESRTLQIMPKAAEVPKCLIPASEPTSILDSNVTHWIQAQLVLMLLTRRKWFSKFRLVCMESPIYLSAFTTVVWLCSANSIVIEASWACIRNFNWRQCCSETLSTP